MKKLVLILLFIATTISAQTTYKDVDIQAAAGNDYEWLLTNVELGMGDVNIQIYLQHNGFVYDETYNYNNRKTLNKTNEYTLSRYKKQVRTGNEKEGYVWLKLFLKKSTSLPLVAKVELFGDRIGVINFYCNFWSRELNFNDVKIGEVVSTRFLSDVATLSFPEANTAKITVVTAKNR